MPTNYLALLRGICVGGKNKLPMKELAQFCIEAGCTDVQNHIRSGNVIFNAAPELLDSIPDRVSAAIAERSGYRVAILLRSEGELGAVVRDNPFLDTGATEDSLHVLFLDDAPDPNRVAGLEAKRSQPDQFAGRGQEVYLHLPNSVARTRLTNDYFDSKPATVSTGRNWKTVKRLLELM